MSNDQLATFTDRREAIALFNMLRGRDPSKPWPLLPILAFVAPGGSGKSLLLRHLRVKECSVDGCAALPYAYLDFTLPHAPKDLLSILMELRDQLQQLDDGQGNHLVFPRFDLGALIALAAPSNEEITSLGPTQVRQRLATGMQIIETLSVVGSSLGSAVPYIAPLFAGLRLAGQIKPLRELLSYLEDNAGWNWYRIHGTETGLGANATMKDVLLRLHMLSMSGKAERDLLLNELLPAAFLSDLHDALLDADPPRAWSKTANIVLFLDGFEALQYASRSTATRLLQVLTTVPRRNGKTDPLLLVVGSREYLSGSSGEEERAHRHRDVRDVVRAIVLYIWLIAASKAITEEVASFQDNLGVAYNLLPGGDREDNLRRAIKYQEAALKVYTRETHPLDWAMAQDNLGLAYRNLPGGDREENLRRAIECYKAALQVRIREAFPVEWARTQNNLGMVYRNLPAGDRQDNLKRAIECYKAALQVRTREAFPVEWAMTQDNLGIAYRELPGGDREENLRRAIEYHEAALQVRIRKVLPVGWAMSQCNLGKAYSLLPHGDLQENLGRAIECYQAALRIFTKEAYSMPWANVQFELGIAYNQLPEGNREVNLRREIEYFMTALQVSTRKDFPIEWATIQGELGNAYCQLSEGDRKANLMCGIEYFMTALQVLQAAHVENAASIVIGNLERARHELKQWEQAGSQD